MSDRVSWTPSLVEDVQLPEQPWDTTPWAYGVVSEWLVIALLTACTLVSLFDLYLLATLR